MQNPVIQRIKRRAEVCQSLPVTCGRRGNDTGNDLVTVVSLQYAVDCFPENGKSSHSKPVTSPLPPSAKCRLDVFFALRPPYVRRAATLTRYGNLHRVEAPRPPRTENDAGLCADYGCEEARSGEPDSGIITIFMLWRTKC